MNFDFIRRVFCLNVNYRIVNTKLSSIYKACNIGIIDICRFVNQNKNVFAKLNYLKFNFDTTQLARVFNIDRSIGVFAEFQSLKGAQLTAPFLIVHNSKKI